MILYGASGHGKVIAEILEANGECNIEFWDDELKPDIWSLPIFKPLFKENLGKEIIVSIGDNKVRKDIANKVNQYFAFSLENGSWSLCGSAKRRKYQLLQAKPSMVSVSRFAGPPHFGHLVLTHSGTLASTLVPSPFG